MFVEVGPAGIAVTGQKGGRPYDFDEAEIKDYLSMILAGVGDSLPVLRQKAERIRNASSMSPAAQKMVEAAKLIDPVTLTPMAAVAGAVADAVKEWLKDKGFEFISVNNGGDIALFNRSGRKVNIALGDIETGKSTPYTLVIEDMVDCGIATSGFGGRSFTLGLADMVTVIARTGAIADAAATRVGNATNIETDLVLRRWAREIDPCSDIADERVTVRIGDLGEELTGKALENGLSFARALKESNSILDAVILMKGHMATTLGGSENIHLEVDYGDQKTGHDCRGYICGR